MVKRKLAEDYGYQVLDWKRHDVIARRGCFYGRILLIGMDFLEEMMGRRDELFYQMVFKWQG